ncbi:MAG: valine--tRNA ligase, partial [Bacteroidota bacterium]|nr:valine--tRNA ligase [Bacteroidota bacterium]
ITEEMYHLLGEQSTDICVSQVAPAGKADAAIIATGDLLKNAITAIRDARNKAQLKPKDEIDLQIQTADQTPYNAVIDLLAKQVNAKSTAFTIDTPPQSITVVAGKEKYFLITGQIVETGQQKEDLIKEKEHLLGFLASVEKKLGNERFMQNAKPEVVALEQKKKQDALAKLDIVEKALSQM